MKDNAIKQKHLKLTPDSEMVKEIEKIVEEMDLSRVSNLDATYPEIIDNKLYDELKDTTSLDVSQIRQSWVVLEVIAKIAETSPVLYTFKFGEDNFYTSEYVYIFQALAKSTSIRELGINGGDKFAKCASETIEYLVELMPNLKSVNLSGNKLGCHTFQITNELMKLPFLEKLDFSNIGGDNSTINSLVDMIETYNSSHIPVNTSLILGLSCLINNGHILKDIGVHMAGLCGHIELTI